MTTYFATAYFDGMNHQLYVDYPTISLTPEKATQRHDAYRNIREYPDNIIGTCWCFIVTMETP